MKDGQRGRRHLVSTKVGEGGRYHLCTRRISDAGHFLRSTHSHLSLSSGRHNNHSKPEHERSSIDLSTFRASAKRIARARGPERLRVLAPRWSDNCWWSILTKLGGKKEAPDLNFAVRQERFTQPPRSFDLEAVLGFLVQRAKARQSQHITLLID